MKSSSVIPECTSFACRRTPVGIVGIGESGGVLTRVAFLSAEAPDIASASPLVEEAFSQLDAWFAGRLREFSLPLVEPRSAFERRVREGLLAIPYGATVAYGELAASVGSPGAARAVGTACGRNPLPVIVPCHRVIAVGGGIGGYSGGAALKGRLLDFERGNCR